MRYIPTKQSEDMKTTISLVTVPILIAILLATRSPTKAQLETVIHSLAWNPAGTILALAGFLNGERALWLIDIDGHLIQQFDMPNGASGVSWRPDGKQVAVNSGGGYTIRDVTTGAILVSFGQNRASIDAFTHWNPADFNQIATVEQDVVHLRNANTGSIQATLDGPGGRPDSVLSVGWSLDGTTLYTVSEDDVIRVWDVNSTALIKEIHLDYGVSAFAMSPDATRLGIGGADGQVRVHDAVIEALLPAYWGMTINFSGNNLGYVVWHPDGTRIAAVDLRVFTFGM